MTTNHVSLLGECTHSDYSHGTALSPRLVPVMSASSKGFLGEDGGAWQVIGVIDGGQGRRLENRAQVVSNCESVRLCCHILSSKSSFQLPFLTSPPPGYLHIILNVHLIPLAVQFSPCRTFLSFVDALCHFLQVISIVQCFTVHLHAEGPTSISTLNIFGYFSLHQRSPY